MRACVFVQPLGEQQTKQTPRKENISFQFFCVKNLILGNQIKTTRRAPPSFALVYLHINFARWKDESIFKTVPFQIPLGLYHHHHHRHVFFVTRLHITNIYISVAGMDNNNNDNLFVM